MDSDQKIFIRMDCGRRSAGNCQLCEVQRIYHYGIFKYYLGMDQCTDACGDYSGWDKIYDQGSIEIKGGCHL